jgi:mRNA-degrading endonuclease RelE of RelBE toxin-antitoxin system
MVLIGQVPGQLMNPAEVELPAPDHAQNAGKTTGRAACSDALRGNRLRHVKALCTESKHRRERMLDVIKQLAKDPYPPSSKALRGYATRRRIRFSSYRIIYEVVAGQLIIHVFDAGNRKGVYEKYDRK